MFFNTQNISIWIVKVMVSKSSEIKQQNSLMFQVETTLQQQYTPG